MNALAWIFSFCVLFSLIFLGNGTLAVVFIIGFFAAVILYFIFANKNAKTVIERQNKDIIADDVQVDAQYIYCPPGERVATRVIIDNTNKNMILGNQNANLKKIPFSDIIGCETKVDSEVTGGVGRAIVGGIIAGGVGAVVGASTAKNQIFLYQIIIYKKTIESPSETITLISRQTNTTDPAYKDAVEFSQWINSTIKAIIEQEKDQQTKQVEQVEPETPRLTQSTTDATVELRKYKELLDDGVITQEDFDKKKNQLLGF